MPHSISRVFITLSVIMLGCSLQSAYAQNTATVINANPQEIEKLWKAKGGLLLDVRTTQEWEEDGFIKGAVRVDAYSKDLSEQVSRKAVDKKKPIFVYCAAGGRSARVAQRLTQEGYTQVYNMKGGIYQWVADGLPVQTK
jgi:phage shock protein E